MKNNIIKYMACAAIALGLAATVQATPIVGSIGFDGTYTQLGDLTTATQVKITSFNFAGLGDLQVATLNSLLSTYYINTVFGPLSPSGQVMWDFLGVNGKTYTFTVTSESQNLTSPSGVHMLGLGTISDGIAADDTTGTWELGFGANGQSFKFESTTAALVPDGGLTVMLLGAALSGLALLRRKLA
jgi:hypothetical protein